MSTINGGSKLPPISSTRPPRWSPSSTWATHSIDEIRERIQYLEHLGSDPREREQKKQLAREKILER